jgi:hypothetical protein
MRILPLQAGGAIWIPAQEDLSNFRILSMAMFAMQDELFVPQAQPGKIQV